MAPGLFAFYKPTCGSLYVIDIGKTGEIYRGVSTLSAFVVGKSLDY